MKLVLLSILFSFTFIAHTFSQDILMLKTSGKVVIGDTTQISTPGPYNLYVQNGILTEKVKVALKNASEWSDDAFENTPSLIEVKETIQNESHLPHMPAANELVEEGYELKDMDAKLLAQIEWLWQHTIELSEQNKALQIQLEALQAELDKKQ